MGKNYHDGTARDDHADREIWLADVNRAMRARQAWVCSQVAYEHKARQEQGRLEAMDRLFRSWDQQKVDMVLLERTTPLILLERSPDEWWIIPAEKDIEAGIWEEQIRWTMEVT